MANVKYAFDKCMFYNNIVYMQKVQEQKTAKEVRPLKL